MILEGKSILLRPLQPDDAPVLSAIPADSALAAAAPAWPPQSGDAPVNDPRAWNLWSVVLPGKNTVIGAVSLGENEDLGEATLNYYIFDAYKGCGYTKEAVTLLSDWAVKQAGLPYVIMTVDESNASMSRVAEKCGFALYEKRVSVSHRLAGLSGDVYFYYRKY